MMEKEYIEEMGKKIHAAMDAKDKVSLENLFDELQKEMDRSTKEWNERFRQLEEERKSILPNSGLFNGLF